MRGLSIAAVLLCCVVSIAMTLQTLREMPRRKAVLADKLQRLDALDRIAAGGTDDAPARRALESLANKIPPELDELMGAALPGASVAIRREDAQPLDQSELGQPISNRPVPIRFENLSLEDGLSMSVAQSVFQDRFGFSWIAKIIH